MFRSRILAFALGLAMIGGAASAATVDVTSSGGTVPYTGNVLAQDTSGSFLLGQISFKKSRNTQTLDVTVDLSVNGVVHSLAQTFSFARTATCAIVGGCNGFFDISTIASALTFTSGNTAYSFAIDGFVEHLGSTVMHRFLVRGGAPRTLYLQASLTMSTVPPSPVPLPAGGLLLVGALGSMAVVRRRKAA